jgi:two-component system, NtrC family, response regulator
MSIGNVLLIDDEDKLRHLLKRIISQEGFLVFEADSLKSGLRQLSRQPVQVILCDMNLPDGDGIQFIEQVKKGYPQIEIIILTGFGNIASGVRAIQQGAFDYLMKGEDNERIIPLLHRAIGKSRLQKKDKQTETGSRTTVRFEKILGRSLMIREAIGMAEKVAPTDATVLLLGETGTGKEVFAHAIHEASPRAGKNFVALNVSTFSKELLESELFGHMAGAFTGALKDKKGLIEEANGGTLFLDEIGEMPIGMQSKLLRVLESSEFIKVGDTRSTQVNIRVITATNRDLVKEMKDGRFREDLFYRLNLFTIELPALRQRKEDIPLLADYFLQQFAVRSHKAVTRMSEEFMNRLVNNDWNGNIRELKNVIERAVILSNSEELTPDCLPADFRSSSHPTHTISAFELTSMEKLHIQRVLNYTKGNKLAASKLLNIGLTTLYRKIDEFKIIS